ncbi:hypothetical protein G7Y89_g12738 [Cudoniella acicularis]|uniref:PH domain-containing protein n=1 Tax=Cudoniella acicularis TaxID=354080 RepID=A0A8H4R9U0_9HELO|nr:hypothetical protein G7Y89_g12738 [Cudoniella acicularis]
MLINAALDATSRGALTDVCAVRMEELFGCWQEAKRADKVAAQLLSLRTDLDPEYYENISAVLKEVECSSRLLRDLYDLFPIYRTRVPVVLYYLNVILPTLCKTMRDMMIYIDNADLPTRTQWRLMTERLGDQGGMTLAQRFAMYCEALVQTVRLLSRSPTYDPTSLELLRVRHMRLRKLQGIPDPQVQIVPHRAPPLPSAAELEPNNRRRFEHSLAVIQDKKCFGLRLHAAVWNGELRKCPVWTAFVTYQSASDQWMQRRSSHRIWLKDIYPYVFCGNYKKKRQMRKHGEFEIYFVDRRAADAFEEVFMEEEKDDKAMVKVPPSAPDGPAAVVMECDS